MDRPADSQRRPSLPLPTREQAPSTSKGTIQEGSEQYNLLFSLLTFNTLSRIVFIKECLAHNGLEAPNIVYITSSVRPSTQKQYNHAWKVFCKFCKASNKIIISDNLILLFFDNLLRD